MSNLEIVEMLVGASGWLVVIGGMVAWILKTQRAADELITWDDAKREFIPTSWLEVHDLQMHGLAKDIKNLESRTEAYKIELKAGQDKISGEIAQLQNIVIDTRNAVLKKVDIGTKRYSDEDDQ